MTACGPVDTFTTSTLAAHWNGTYGTAPTISAGHITIGDAAGYSGITSTTNASLDEAELVVEVVDGTAAANTEWYVLWNPTSGPNIGIGNNAGTVYCYGNPDTTVGTYNATTHRWIRIRETGGTIYWERSPDGLTWTALRTSTTTGYTLTGGYVELGSGKRLTVYDNVNNPPVAAVNATPTAVAVPVTINAAGTSISRTAAPAVIAATQTTGTVTPTTSAEPVTVAYRADASIPPVGIVIAGNTLAAVDLHAGTSTIGDPTVTATATVQPYPVDTYAWAPAPDGLNSSGDINAAALTARSRANIPRPTPAGFIKPIPFAGQIKRWNGSAWTAGRLNYNDNGTWRAGQLNAIITPAALQRVLVDDSGASHESYLDGVPEFASWGLGPVTGLANCAGPDNTWTALLPWAQLYPEAGWVPTRNTICAVRNITIAVLSAATGAWSTLGVAASAKDLYALYQQYNFSGGASGPESTYITTDGNLAGIPGFGFSLRFYPNSAQITAPHDVAAIAAWFQARVEIAPDAKTDDRASSRFLAGCAGDWMATPSTTVGDTKNTGTWAIGRHRFITSDWTTFTCHTMNWHQIRRSPPPITVP